MDKKPGSGSVTLVVGMIYLFKVSCVCVSGDVASMTDVLCELRSCGRGATPQAENLARKIQSRVGEGQAVSRHVTGYQVS